jgi:hypothetical protein
VELKGRTPALPHPDLWRSGRRSGRGIWRPGPSSAGPFNGWTSAPTAGAPPVESEGNFHLDGRPERKPLQGLRFRVQYGRSTVWQGGTVTGSEEQRVVLNYDLKLY